MATIVIGIGNPVLTDDSVGIKIVRCLETKLGTHEDLVTRELCAGGLRLMEAMQGYEQAIIIDAIVTPGGEPGSVYFLEPADLRKTKNTCSSHDANLVDALELGKLVGLALPEKISIWAIEAGDTDSFSEDLTDEVQAAMTRVVEGVIRQLNENCSLPA